MTRFGVSLLFCLWLGKSGERGRGTIDFRGSGWEINQFCCFFVLCWSDLNDLWRRILKQEWVTQSILFVHPTSPTTNETNSRSDKYWWFIGQVLSLDANSTEIRSDIENASVALIVDSDLTLEKPPEPVEVPEVQPDEIRARANDATSDSFEDYFSKYLENNTDVQVLRTGVHDEPDNFTTTWAIWESPGILSRLIAFIA